MNTQASNEGLEGEGRLADSAWLQRIARGLVGDAAAGDDLAQEAWARLIGKRRRPARLRPYLAGTVRKLALEHWRGERRRRRHEEAAARQAPIVDQASPDQTLERIGLQRSILDILASLPELQREVLVLRYFDGIEPTEIAARRGVSAGTVRSQLKRGLDALRLRLDADTPGGRDAWLSVLVPILTESSSGAVLAAPVTTAPLTLLAMKITSALVAVSLVAAILVVRRGADDATTDAASVDEALALETREDAGRTPAHDVEPADPEVERALEGPAATARRPVAEPSPTTLRGHLVDRSGGRISGARVSLSLVPTGITRAAVYSGRLDVEDEERVEVGHCRSDSNGGFRFDGVRVDTERDALLLCAENTGHGEAIMILDCLPEEEVHFVVDAQPSIGVLTGQVVDEHGRPLGDFSVVVVPRDVEDEPRWAGSNRELARQSFVDAGGSFQLEIPMRVLATEYFDVVVLAEGFRPARQDFTSASFGPREHTRFTVVAADLLRGHVQGPGGEAVKGASVAVVNSEWQRGTRTDVHAERTTTDQLGDFEIHALPALPMNTDEGAELHWIDVSHPDYSSARVPASEIDLESGELTVTLAMRSTLGGVVVGLSDYTHLFVQASVEDLTEPTATSPGWNGRVAVGEDGTFHFTEVPAGRLHVYLQRIDPGGAGDRQTTLSTARWVTVAAGESKEIELRPDGTGTVTGVVDIEGLPEGAIYTVFLCVETASAALAPVAACEATLGDRGFSLPNVMEPGRPAFLRVHLNPELRARVPVDAYTGDIDLGRVALSLSDFTASAGSSDR